MTDFEALFAKRWELVCEKTFASVKEQLPTSWPPLVVMLVVCRFYVNMFTLKEQI